MAGERRSAACSLVEKHTESVLSGSDQVEPAGTAQVRQCEMNPASLGLSEPSVGDDLLGESFAGPFEVIDAVVVPLPRLPTAVGAVTLPGYQFLLTVAVDVRPD